MKPCIFTTLTRVAAWMLLLGGLPNVVAATLLGPSPYRAFDNTLPGAGGAISPFVGQAFGYFHLETFEDHLLNTPGVSFSASPGSGVTRVVSGSAFVDSVDADDGVIDGSGLNGDSFFGFDGGVGIRFTFNAGTLGALPTHVGIVWTDSYFSYPVQFQAFGPGGNLLGTIGPTNVLGEFPDDSFNGETAEDRFFGVINAEGISSIFISSSSIAGIEVDHLQYGFKPNSAPQFTNGPDVTVSENVGPQTVTGWATGISPSTPAGIPGETNQTVQFIVSNDNPALFSSQPAISPNGTLSFTPAPNGCGVANVSAVARDNGGTAVGGDDTSDPQLFTINVSCPTNQCPSAVPSVAPTLSIGCVGLSNVVLAADNASACVVLDATGSTDPDGDTLTYSWTVDGLFTTSLDGAQDGGGARMGSGSGTVALTDNTLAVDVTFSGLSAGVTAAHIHGPAAPGVNAAVLYPLNSITTLGVPAGTIRGTVTLAAGTGGFSITQQSEQLRDGKWYINIHNASFPGGEIRGQLLPTAQGARTTNCLPIGSHKVCLTVSDGRCSDTKCVTVEVISPCQAIGTLMLAIEDSSLPRSQQRPLLATLRAACAAFERGDTVPAVNQLEAFQNKVRALVQPDTTALAQQLIDCAQAIINGVGGV